MSANSKIEWCDHTFNPWIGCQEISPACVHCYARVSTPARVLRSKGTETWGPHAARQRTSASNWTLLRRWNAQADSFMAQHGRRQRVFCASLADVFDNAVPVQWFTEFLDLCRLTPRLDKLLLTKRIGNVKSRLAQALEHAHEVMLNPPLAYWIVNWLDGDHPPMDVWLGATVVNQAEADRDVPKLLAAPASVRFLSLEPLLGPVSFVGMFANAHPVNDGTNALEALDWVIVGGESGVDARPMSALWAREIRDQCAAVAVPFLFKQWGEWAPAMTRPSGAAGRFAFGDYEDDRTCFVQTDQYPRAFARFGARCVLERVGKSAAGRRLDGVTHDGFPVLYGEGGHEVKPTHWRTLPPPPTASATSKTEGINHG